MRVPEFLLRFLNRHQNDPSLAYDLKESARLFINSPAYAVLLSEAGFGQTVAKGDERDYLARQQVIFRITDMAGMDAGAVAKQVADYTQHDQLYNLGRDRDA